MNIDDMNKYSIKQIIEIIDLQARMQLKAQVNKLFLSYFWWFLEPLLFVALFYFVFGLLMKRGGGVNFVLFLLVGKVVFMWFSKGAVMGSTSLRKNTKIIMMRDIPKWVFPLVSVQVATYKSLIALIILLSVLLLSGNSDPRSWWQLIILILLSYLFISSVACLLSLLVAVAEDFSQLISLFMIIMMFGSGIFWDINSISNKQLVDIVLIVNPLAGLIDSYRTVILNGNLVEPQRLYSVLIASMIIWGVNIIAFKRFNNSITRLIIS